MEKSPEYDQNCHQYPRFQEYELRFNKFPNESNCTTPRQGLRSGAWILEGVD